MPAPWRSSRSRPRHPRAPRCGHHYCPAHPERLVPALITRCWLCEQKDAEFTALDDALAEGRGDKPRVKLTKEPHDARG